MALVATGLWELIEPKGAGFAVGFSTSTQEVPGSAGLGGTGAAFGGAATHFQ